MGQMMRLSIAVRNEILEHARDAADVEVCGLLFGEGDRIDRAMPCRNVAPDPTTRFEIDPAMLIAAHRAARRGEGPAVIGHYHSHPNGRPDPSPRDAAAAAPDGHLWLIVADDTITAWRATANGAIHGRFDAVKLVTDGCGPAIDSSQGASAATPIRPVSSR
jgi:proteasome lid subunit RPN8/RPN11